MAEQSAFLTAFDEMQKKKLEQQGFNAPAQMESVVDTVGQAPAAESPFSQQAAAATDPLATPVDLSGTPAVQAPPSLVTDNPFAPSVGVSEPTVPQDAQDATERARIEDRLARTNADIIASGETVGGVEKEAFKPMGGGFSFGGNTPIPADRTDSFIPVVNEILKRTGASEFEDQGKAQVEAPSVDPFGVTSSEIAAAGNQNFGRAVSQAQPENPYRTQYGVNSLDRGVIDEIQQQDVAAPQAQLPSTIQNANGQNLAGFKPKYKGQSLTDFMAGRDDPSAASVQVQDPQGRFRRQAAPVAGETPEQNQARTDALFPEQADFREESAARESRQAARPDFGEAQERAAGTVTDRERRAARGDGMSDADRRDIAKANQRGASAGDVARGMKVAELNNVDLKTGKPLASEGGLTFDQAMKMKDFDFKRDQEAYKREQDSMTAAGKASEAFDKDEALLRQVSGDAGRIGRLTNEAIGVTTETGTTGLAGSLLKHVPGTDAHKLDSILEVVSSKVALDRLMEVKKTGATLGQVSEKELAMLQNSYDTLKQGLKGERLRKALVNYATQLKAVEDRTAKAFIGKHGQEKFDQIMGGGGSSGGEPRYANDQNVGDSAESYYNPSK